MSETLDDLVELDGLAAAAPELDDDGATPASSPTSSDPKETAEASAAIVVYMTEEIVRHAWPFVTYTAEQRATFSARLVPVLAKYNGALPTWVEPWKEEIHLAAFLAMTGYATWAQIQAHKAADGEEPKPNAA